METFRSFWASLDREQREKDCAAMTADDVCHALNAEELTPRDFLALLSPAAAPYLEAMAQRARELTTRYFGYAVNVFTPLYISDVCTNHCRYCGFNVNNKQKRTHLSVDEAVEEAMAIARQGFEDILLLTGEAPKLSSPEYIARAMKWTEVVSILDIRQAADSRRRCGTLAKAARTGARPFQTNFRNNAWSSLMAPSEAAAQLA